MERGIAPKSGRSVLESGRLEDRYHGGEKATPSDPKIGRRLLLPGETKRPPRRTSPRRHIVRQRTWIVAEVASVEIASSETDPDQRLLKVRGVVRQSNGELIVANRGSESLLAYDSLGNYLAEIGRPGEGPGEFAGLAGLGMCAADTIAAWSRNGVSLFDAEREFVRSIPANLDDDAGRRRVEGISSDCSKVLVTDQTGRPSTPKIRSWPHAIRWLPEDGEPVTIREFPGRPMATVGGEFTRPLPFGAVPVWATDGDRVYLGLADRPEILVFDGRGAELASIRWDAVARPVIDQDRSTGKGLYEDHVAVQMQRLPPEVASQIPWPRWEDIPLAETKPFYSDLLVDDEGNLWVLEYPDALGGQPPEVYRPRVGDEPEIWSVFSREGALQASVAMPSELQLQAVAGDYAIGVFRDELGVEVIRLHRLLKGEEENGQ